jgi:DNA primase
MPLFPQSFIDDLRLQADIVQVVQDHVPLRRTGATYKGLCPFHSEKTPSFQVNRDKGFFHCFGCGVGGDVFKFVELHEKVGFQDAVRLLAQRFGVPMPELVDAREASDAAGREALLKAHEAAALWFQQQLESVAGEHARQQLRDRGVGEEVASKLGLGYAPVARDALKRHLLDLGYALETLQQSGLVVRRDSGDAVDRFRARLMIPICRDSGSVVAFGGRAMEADQQPKYLNSPETPIYAKSRTLYGLHLTRHAIRQAGYAVLVEGYFDFAQLLQAGIAAVVASCGTALTPHQCQLLRRFTSKVVLSFDPDTAGQGAAVRSCELLVAEGFNVNVALLPAGEDPDTVVRRRGREAYQELLRRSQPYLEFLLDRAAGQHDLSAGDGRRAFLQDMLTVAARIPDAAQRDQFADRLAHKARSTEDVVRAEIRKAAVARRTTVTTRELPTEGVKPAERGLLWALVHQPAMAISALDELEDQDLSPLATRHVIEVARSLHGAGTLSVPGALLERLSEQEARLVTAIAAESACPAPVEDCVRAVRLLRYDRERAALQQEIDRLQEDATPATIARIEQLGLQKIDLKRRIEALSSEPSSGVAS